MVNPFKMTDSSHQNEANSRVTQSRMRHNYWEYVLLGSDLNYLVMEPPSVSVAEETDSGTLGSELPGLKLAP